MTAGVDRIRILTGKQRIKLSHNLTLKQKAKPLRRIWIPKPNSSEKRPLGIPTISNRVQQALLKIVLEPEWEARFEPNSYGFRPGRSAHDAIGAIFNCINQRSKWVLDADIEKCFDKIDHTKLLSKLNTIPIFRQLIKGWLKAGVLDNGVFLKTEASTPQGGVISPLLANIALHGMEHYIMTLFKQRRISPTRLSPKVTFIRYADDFLVFHESREVIEACRDYLEKWLSELGLSMKASKTSIVHTLESSEDGKVGFNFLGMHVRQYKVGRTHTGKDQRGNPLGFKTIIKPSKDAQKRHYLKMKEIIVRQKSSPQEALIREINPVIRGWSEYYKTVVSKDVFSRMDFLLYKNLFKWAMRRHRGKHRKRVVRKYWRLETGRWRFEQPNGAKLYYHSYMAIKRHVKVRGVYSPYDGDWIYWGKRLLEYGNLSSRKLKLLKFQNGKCPHCHLYFTTQDIVETDHIIPLSLGGKDKLENLQLLHGHCHHQKTSVDGSHNACNSNAQRGAV